MTLSVEPLAPERRDEWNRFVDESNGGTLFHRLDFLAYHHDRFEENECHLVIRKGDALFGVMPMAIFDEEDGRVARSPYGGSYGGPVFAKPLHYAESREVLQALLAFFEERDVAASKIVWPIPCCYAEPSDTLRLVFVEEGFRLANRDTSSVVCLDDRLELATEVQSRKARLDRKMRKAREEGVEIAHRAPTEDFWQVLEKSFSRLDVKPTHTFEEIVWLRSNLQDRVQLDVAYLGGVPIASIALFFVNHRVGVTFYLCVDPDHRTTQAQTLLIREAMDRLQKQNVPWLDLGTSSSQQRARPNLFRFKESFGAVGQFRETYVWRRDAS